MKENESTNNAAFGAEIGARFQALRVKGGLSLNTVREQGEISASEYLRLENGSYTPTPAQFRALLVCFGVGVDALSRPCRRKRGFARASYLGRTEVRPLRLPKKSHWSYPITSLQSRCGARVPTTPQATWRSDDALRTASGAPRRVKARRDQTGQ